MYNKYHVGNENIINRCCPFQFTVGSVATLIRVNTIMHKCIHFNFYTFILF